MRSSCLVVLVLASCGHNTTPPDAPTEFDYRATFFWWSVEMPQIVSVTIDDAPLQDGESYMIEQTFASYDDAVANFQPRQLVVTTTTGVQDLQLVPAQCSGQVNEGNLVRPILSEEDDFILSPLSVDPTQLYFGADCGHCVDRHGEVGWCSRVGTR